MVSQRVRRTSYSGVGMKGLGDTPGCPAGNLSELLGPWVQGVVAFPSSINPESPLQAASEIVAQFCGESADGSPFGCPPMAGCDAAGQASAAAQAAALIMSSPRYVDISQYGMYAPPTQNNPLPVTIPTTVTSIPYTPLPVNAPPASVASLGVQFTNTTRGGSVFQIGDNWRLVVTGPPNQPVTANAIQNGTSLGTTPMGNTDATGTLTLTGSIAPSSIGTWQETWLVGGQLAGNVSFTVPNPPAATTTAAPPSNGLSTSAPTGNTGLPAGSVNQNQGGSNTPLGPNGGTNTSPDTTSATNWFTQEMITGFPNWALLAAGLGAALILPTLGKR